MGLLATIRSGVKIVDKATRDLQSITIFERYLSQDGAGGKTYAAPVQLKAIVEDKQEIVRTVSGQLSQSRTTIQYLDITALLAATNNLGVKESDRITLQNGDGGPILAIGGFIDAGTGVPVATQVYLG